MWMRSNAFRASKLQVRSELCSGEGAFGYAELFGGVDAGKQLIRGDFTGEKAAVSADGG
jgi:hypothetical protein